ncbi:uncharacterized protein LOC134225960 [Armigeres subalbatus]|uniref:uncharacterized protein LOC134225960 n=1 Tax=Armigeres subalbatus TaxID=124917 RepID=UPI002ED5A441
MFHKSASKLVMAIALLLVHHSLVVWSAPPGSPVPSNSSVTINATRAESPESDLLDGTKLPFLVSCDADKVEIVFSKLCELYRFLVDTVLTQRKPEPVAIDEVKKVVDEQVDASRFCDNLVPVLNNRNVKHTDHISQSPLQTENVCSRWCLLMNEDLTKLVGVQPICKVLLWGLKEELISELEMVAQNPTNKVAEIIIPPLLPGNVEIEKVEEKDVQNKPAGSVATQAKEKSEKPLEQPSDAKINATEDDKKTNSDKAVEAAPSNDVNEIAKSASNKDITVDTETKQSEDILQSDLNETQNLNNIREMNSEGNINNELDTNDEFSDEDQFEPESVLPKESPVKDEVQLEQDLPNGADSDGFSVEQPAAAAVQIERVDPFFDQEDSNFFTYFMFMMFACIMCYVAYHNKSKLLALLVEGRRTSSGRGGFSKGGRKHTAAYRKLDSNLEEAITSNASASSRSTSQIIY